MYSKKTEVFAIIFIQVVLLILFVIFATYDGKYEWTAYPMFQDVHVMIFIGFGFLMTFLRRYGYSAVSFNFLLGALIIQWALLCQGFYQLNENNKMELGIGSLYKADIAAAAVLISMGAVLGRTSYMQLLVMGVVEIAVFSASSYLGSAVFQVADAGGSIFVHTFGAYFGLAVSYIIEIKQEKSSTSNSLEEARYTSDIFAMIGTIFLWLFWPSFNAIEATGEGQQRAIINTYLSLASCCVTTFAISLLLTEDHKFDMVHIQNSTLAGGVAVGTSANLMLQPYGAILVGVAAGVLSVAGYAKLTPYLSKKFRIKDTCGVHNLHGMPGVLAGLIGALMAGLASESIYDKALYEIYPARADSNVTAGSGRTAGAQAGYQVLAVVVTAAIAVVSGLVTGSILSVCKYCNIPAEKFYDDGISWILPEHAPPAEEKPATSPYQFDNPSFELPVTNGAPKEAFN